MRKGLQAQPKSGSRECLRFLEKLLIKDSVEDPKLKLSIEQVVDGLERLRKGEQI